MNKRKMKNPVIKLKILSFIFLTMLGPIWTIFLTLSVLFKAFLYVKLKHFKHKIKIFSIKVKVHQVINTTFCNLKVIFLINSDYYSHTQVV